MIARASSAWCYRTPRERAARRMRRWGVALVLALGLLVLTILDRAAWRALMFDPDKSLERADWWQVLRQFGSLTVWAILAVMLVLHDRVSPSRRGSAAWHRGLMVLAGAALGGLIAEVLKGVTLRGRPAPDGLYRFGWWERFEGGLGLASSHAGTAFGGAIMLGWFFPAIRVPVLLLAAGCAMTRLAVGAHFVTDVYVAVVCSYAANKALWRVFSRFPGGADAPQG
jgi:membrane-associated phospholipid phosphatase